MSDCRYLVANRNRRTNDNAFAICTRIKTGISIYASAHLAAVTPHCPFFEYLPAELTDSKLRQELVQDDLKLVDGKLAIPQKPGLGIEVNMDALQRFKQD
jgi:L-alanine-DL-glutamate epimerase-like enolase superfamily enzyme